MRKIAILLSVCVGFLSLSQEIAWVKIMAPVQQGRPQAFSLVLVAFLFGISLGSVIGRRICERASNVLRGAGFALLLAAASDVISLWLCATSLVSRPEGSPRLQVMYLIGLLVLVGLGACLKAIIFPIVHHVGSVADESRVGRSVSYVYVGNVLGSTLGPIVTGFFLLDWMSVESVFALIALGSTLLACVAFAASGTLSARAQWLPSAAVMLVCAMVIVSPPRVMERIVDDGRGQKLLHLIQNRHGVIHVVKEEHPGWGDITYGGNIYDGRLNVDVGINTNLLDRAYVVAAIHPRPKRALVVGMSSGAWTSVILGFPGLEHLDVVEINPGYLEIVKRYPAVAPVLSDPRVHVHIDDGRRWLRARPTERYDVIFQNTSYHWRAYATMQLSQEYLKQLRSHLNPGGIVAINTTGSLDAFETAQSVFPHTARYINFVYMSDSPLQKRSDAEQVLRECKAADHPAFQEAAFGADGLGASLARGPLESGSAYVAQARKDREPRIISDMNMVNEYRHGTVMPFDWYRKLLPSDSTGPWN